MRVLGMTEQKSPEEIAKEVFHSLFCDLAVLRMYSDSKKYHAAIEKLASIIKAERSTRNTCKNCRKDPCVKKDQQNYIHESTSNVVDSKQAFPSNEEIKAFKNSFIRVNDPVKETLKQLTINATVEFFDNWFKKHGS